jgi:hypothetical protein
MGPRPPTEFVPNYPLQSADSGFVRQQIPRQMDSAWPSSQGSACAWNLLAGSCLHQSTNESHSPYNPGGFRVDFQQNPWPIAAAPPSQGTACVQNAWVPFSQDYLNFTFLGEPLPAEKRKALVVCDGQTLYKTRMLIPVGVEDRDQLL